MAERRFAIPYVSHLVLTQRQTQVVRPTGVYTQDGRELLRNGVDIPGIVMEVTNYIVTSKQVDGATVETSKKGPAKVYQFFYRKYWEEAQEDLESLPNPSDEEKKDLEIVRKKLADKKVLWVEDAIQSDYLQLWYDVFSDALDEFPSMNEQKNIKGGIPLDLLPMQWDIRVPYESNKVVTLKTGAFLNANFDKIAELKAELARLRAIILTVEEDSDEYDAFSKQLAECAEELREEKVHLNNNMPEIIDLTFEDQKSKDNRLADLATYNTVIARLTKELAELEVDTDEYRNKQKEMAPYITERDLIASVEYRTISDLLQHPSVQNSLVSLLMGLLGVLKAKYFPQLDLQMVQERMIASLATIR